LFRIAPAVLAAADQAAAQVLLSKWIESLGPVKLCNPCVELEQDALHGHPERASIRKSEGSANPDRKPTLAADLELRPDMTWIHDEELLGRQLSQSLILIEHNRVANQQFYVSLLPGVHNPSFEHEPAYAQVKLPDAGFQLLALSAGANDWHAASDCGRDRSIFGAQGREIDGRGDGECGGAKAVQHGPDHDLCRGSAAAGEYGNLCGCGVLGVPAHAGDCDPHGGRRATCGDCTAGLGVGSEAGAAGVRAGCGWITGRVADVSAFLFDVSATDPLIYAGSVALMLFVALLASAQPAIRAAAADPTHALRTT
jgi:hypothetical protein